MASLEYHVICIDVASQAFGSFGENNAFVIAQGVVKVENMNGRVGPFYLNLAATLLMLVGAVLTTPLWREVDDCQKNEMN